MVSSNRTPTASSNRIRMVSLSLTHTAGLFEIWISLSALHTAKQFGEREAFTHNQFQLNQGGSFVGSGLLQLIEVHVFGSFVP